MARARAAVATVAASAHMRTSSLVAQAQFQSTQAVVADKANMQSQSQAQSQAPSRAQFQAQSRAQSMALAQSLGQASSRAQCRPL